MSADCPLDARSASTIASTDHRGPERRFGVTRADRRHVADLVGHRPVAHRKDGYGGAFVSQSHRIVTCTFCGLRGPRSREDAFPHWLIKAIGGNIDVIAMSQFTRTPGDSTPIDRRAYGSAAVYKLSAVCATCNNEWLNQLEEAAAPLLTPLLDGDRVAISPLVQAIIGCWAYKTTVAFDACQTGKADGRRIAAEHGTRRFYDDQRPPPGASVWLGRFAKDTITGFALPHLRVQLLAPQPPVVEQGAERFTFVFGHLLLQVIAPYEPSETHPFLSYALADDDVPLVRCWPPNDDDVLFPDAAVPVQHLGLIYFAQARLQ